MSQILGLDVSTSVTGISIVENTKDFDPKKHILFYDAIIFKDTMSFWDKCDYFKTQIQNILQKYPDIEKFGVEAPLARFANKSSSASTICTLQRFNGIVSYIVRDLIKKDASYINVTHARKACGIKIMQKKKSGGLNAKQQTAKHMLLNDLSYISFPLKRGHDSEQCTIESIKGHVFDIIDAYVVARGTMILM